MTGATEAGFDSSHDTTTGALARAEELVANGVAVRIVDAEGVVRTPTQFADMIELGGGTIG